MGQHTPTRSGVVQHAHSLSLPLSLSRFLHGGARSERSHPRPAAAQADANRGAVYKLPIWGGVWVAIAETTIVLLAALFHSAFSMVVKQSGDLYGE